MDFPAQFRKNERYITYYCDNTRRQYTMEIVLICGINAVNCRLVEEFQDD